MTVSIDNLNIALPVGKTPTDTVSIEIPGPQALAQYPNLVTRLPDGSLQLTAPTKGVASKSVHRTRCEWKEPIYWALSGATEHVNHQLMKVTQVNSAQKVVVAQMHVKDDDSPLLKVFWQKGKLTMGFRQNFNQTTPVNSTVLDNVPLGAEFDILILATSSLMLTVQASCNGRNSAVPSMPLDVSWAARVFDFHGGVYNQIDFTDTTLASDASVCVIKDLQIRHA
ncbi:polysaccharide lyase family 7 protein [Pseudomonas sp. PDM23]|uniref:polysaccharide lyase family 7 protein n=1 Tax=unclassified Pseudomonas TaxID=196821 RepID=UPI0009D938FB|nr:MULTISPECIES: polysaccharide lyase family 7 protein [unclassified Pseudomonas]OQR32944.1 polysaccharide lyase family 7 protein [Pseudomonas sp. T]MBD9500650.1 polysaccharide lyase family 7 protein [Pseudomonas sp. PDM17]MBD9516166.1 polysaccharide lyase family 7 protein [Pseudomonas sp. PDM22]MBD9577666.1 polysaccharide lyase family 7 protein [Pseudomonas sp. PDM23]MBD9672226.1 polysaccharide lyase family 7 protein [Pseudomonas sp. PDM21]